MYHQKNEDNTMIILLVVAGIGLYFYMQNQNKSAGNNNNRNSSSGGGNSSGGGGNSSGGGDNSNGDGGSNSGGGSSGGESSGGGGSSGGDSSSGGGSNGGLIGEKICTELYPEEIEEDKEYEVYIKKLDYNQYSGGNKWVSDIDLATIYDAKIKYVDYKTGKTVTERMREKMKESELRRLRKKFYARPRGENKGNPWNFDMATWPQNYTTAVYTCKQY